MQSLNRNINGTHQTTLLHTQYSLLSYFSILLDFMIEKKVPKVHLVSNSSYYLLFFGIFITSNICQLLRKESLIPNPLALMFERGYLIVESCNSIKERIRKRQTFLQIASSSKIRNFISIGDGADEELSSMNVAKCHP